MTTTSTDRYLLRCGARHTIRIDGMAALEAHWNQHGYSKCSCGRPAQFATIHGVQSDHPCDARCTAARRGDCECSCAGANHGADYAMIGAR